MILHKGEIAETRTGEGKTLVAILPAYLNALTGKSVHVVTVNDYLARQSLQIRLQFVRLLLEKEYSLNSARLPSMSNNTEFEEAELEDEAEQLTRREERLRFWSDPDTELKLAKNTGVGVFRMGVNWTRIMPNEPSPKL